LPEKAVPEMTYIVSGGTLNPSTHSLGYLNLRLQGMAWSICGQKTLWLVIASLPLIATALA